MRWDDSVRCVMPPGDAGPVCDEVRRRWRGARLYIPLRAARLDGAEPCGAAERFAADLADAVRARGGDDDRARSILLALAGEHQIIT